MSVNVPIHGLRLVSEANSHTHWRRRSARAKAQRNVVALVLRGTVARQMMHVAPLVVTITRVAPSAGLDSDNLVGSAKHVRDAVAEVLGIDDRDASVRWAVDQERGPWGVRIRIEPAPATNVRDMPSGPLTAGD